MCFTRWLLSRYVSDFYYYCIVLTITVSNFSKILWNLIYYRSFYCPREFDDYERTPEIARVNGELYWTLSRRSTRVNCVSRISTSRKKDGHGRKADVFTWNDAFIDERRGGTLFLDDRCLAVETLGIIHVPFLRASRANRGTKTICTRQSVAKHYL